VAVPPTATAVRRRRASVLAAAAAAFVLGLTFGARHDTRAPTLPAEVPAPQATVVEQPAAPTSTPDVAAVDKLPLQEQVGKLIVLRFAGTSAPEYVRDALRNGWTAGAILFRDNISSPQQLKALTRQLRGASGTTTPIICTDQEGGEVRNVSWAPPSSAQDGQVPGRDATAAAKALRAAGLNVSLAPVADVPSVDGAALGGRAYARDPQRVSKSVAAAVNGWRAGGVAATAKHFPGLGGATINTDQGSATIAGGAPSAADIAPFKAAIAARVPLIMSSHARYPRLDNTYIASQSHAILDTLLRGQLGYEGVVITDSIEAAAVRATGSTEQAAVRSIRAGNDIVLTTGQGSWIRAYRALMAEARASDSFRARVKESAARVMALQDSLR
jgi:beta-N-acetylhexosaminidase